MKIRQLRKHLATERKIALRRFEKQRRKNLLATPGDFPYIIVLDRLKPVYNIGKIFRSAEAFGAHEVHLIGIDFFDPAPAMGSFKWVPARFHETFETCYQDLTTRGYELFTLEPAKGKPLTSAALPEKSAFIFGHEEFGISFDPQDFEGISSLRIPQRGKVQSLNVSVAASLVMYEYFRQHGAYGSGIRGLSVR